jgi:hypothetical protein
VPEAELWKFSRVFFFFVLFLICCIFSASCFLSFNFNSLLHTFFCLFFFISFCFSTSKTRRRLALSPLIRVTRYPVSDLLEVAAIHFLFQLLSLRSLCLLQLHLRASSPALLVHYSWSVAASLPRLASTTRSALPPSSSSLITPESSQLDLL